jgi:hypothetical protein
VQRYWLSEFPNLLSYNRFIELMPELLAPITAFMASRRGVSAGIAFIDSMPLGVCENIRIPRHQTFVKEVGRGKSSTGWLYGFKLHLIVNDQGEILSFCITPGNVDDRKPVPDLVKLLTGKLVWWPILIKIKSRLLICVMSTCCLLFRMLKPN